MKKKHEEIVLAHKIEERSFIKILGENYFNYAISTITSRSLPDVRDGLKPVHRRLLYAMKVMGLKPSDGFKKCARVVGDVIGKYHPHGDQAVYDSMVRLAQDFSVRYPLVDGHGNFGSIDGDNAAAMRYTEANITTTASLLMEGLDEGAVSFVKTYDDEEEEPTVFPGAFPNLLANGSSGIAVGMATSIPAHNIIEVCDAVLYFISQRNKGIDCKDFTDILLGPDFPTGGLLIETKDSIRKSYATGRGSFRLRSKWKKEMGENEKYKIIIYEIPYGVQKARLIEKILEIMHNNKGYILSDIRDESAEDIRIILIPRKFDIKAEIIMKSLFDNTDLEIKISLNFNVIDIDRQPKLMSLNKVIERYFDYRKEVIVKKNNYRLSKYNKRLLIVEAFLFFYINLEKIISIIRKDSNPKSSLMKIFKMEEIQANAILDMKLRSLRKLEEKLLQKEKLDLTIKCAFINKLLSSSKMQSEEVKKEILQIKNYFANNSHLSKRRTEISNSVLSSSKKEELLSEAVPVKIICSHKGWIRIILDQDINNEIKYKDGDGERFVLNASSKDKLLVVSKSGKVFTLDLLGLPQGNSQEKPISVFIDIKNVNEILSMLLYEQDKSYILVSSIGKGFIVNSESLISYTKNGKNIMLFGDEKSNLSCFKYAYGSLIAIVSKKGKLLIFDLKQMPVLDKGKGVIMQKYAVNDNFSDAKVFDKSQGLVCTMSIRKKLRIDDFQHWYGTRSNVGKNTPKQFPKNYVFDYLKT